MNEFPNPSIDTLAFRVAEIIASMKSNNGTQAIWILQLEEALDHYDADYDEYMNEVLIDEGIFPDET
jgi:hypothetical protein